MSRVSARAEVARGHRARAAGRHAPAPQGPRRAAEDLLGLFYQAYRCWYFPFTLIPGAAPITARARAAIVEASLGKDVVSYYQQGLWRHGDGASQRVEAALRFVIGRLAAAR